MLRLAPSGRFRRDVKRALKRGKDLGKLTAAIDLLASGQPLSASYNDHPLKGDWKGWRDIHLEPDWLLLYRVEGSKLQLARTGSHADLFDE
ncbi:type II toxin-antitoxin system YafQ family toxin [uncultured Rhodoblastus sp.]|uniref:type II toxin-antitoxin system RelE/ParE family toxin n=1 Tax=uncultured Rhodoblastus sp. TaxID=543037 RepID=UPI0025F4E828|nr:type II toxin-antitoxin system YafQ family toxin [uncultured Rhodoblastus sp.]